jgi:hypothetical protein
VNTQYTSFCRLAPLDKKAATCTARLRRTAKRSSICRYTTGKALLALISTEALFAGVSLFSAQFTYAQALSPSLVYSSYLGGREPDFAESVAVDAQGYVYITGETHSRNFPVVNAHQTECRLGSQQSCSEAFVTKLKPDGNGIVYSTYFGGTSNDKGYAIAADAEGNAYVAGAMDNSAFVAKFDAAGRLAYQRTLDGYPSTIGRAITVDAAGNAYVTGLTLSREFPYRGRSNQTLAEFPVTPSVVVLSRWMPSLQKLTRQACLSTPLTWVETVTILDWASLWTQRETPISSEKPVPQISLWPMR